MMQTRYIRNVPLWSGGLLFASFVFGLVQGLSQSAASATHHSLDITLSNVLSIAGNNILIFLIMAVFSLLCGIGGLFALRQMSNIGYSMLYTAKSMHIPFYKVYITGSLHGAGEIYSFFLVVCFSLYCIDYVFQLVTGKTDLSLLEFFKSLFQEIKKQFLLGIAVLFISAFVEVYVSSFLFDQLFSN